MAIGKVNFNVFPRNIKFAGDKTQKQATTNETPIVAKYAIPADPSKPNYPLTPLPQDNGGKKSLVESIVEQLNPHCMKYAIPNAAPTNNTENATYMKYAIPQAPNK